MANARDEILARVREALKVTAPKPHFKSEPVSGRSTGTVKAWLPDGGETLSEQLNLLTENLAKLKANLVRVSDAAAAHEALQQIALTKKWKKVAYHSHPLVSPAAEALNCEKWEVTSSFDKQKLEGCDAGITSCEALVAQLGSILVSSESSGGRSLSVLPPVHVVIATVDQVVADLEVCFAEVLAKHGQKLPSMLSFITGPSRTGDIERILVLGAHGPKELYVILIG